MKRFLMVMAATAMLTACGSAAADDPEVASLSTTPAAGDATTGTGDTTESAPDTTVATDPAEAALQFAECMREHGIDMPDPQVSDEGGVMVQVGGPDGESGTGPDPKEMEAANKDCEHFMEDATAGFDPPSEEDQKKMQEQALAFSKCMRDHGIDMPDPQFSADGGGFNVSIGSPDAAPIDFDSDEFKEANEACGGADGGGFVFSSDAADG